MSPFNSQPLLLRTDCSLLKAIDFSFFRAVVGRNYGHTGFYVPQSHTGSLSQIYLGTRPLVQSTLALCSSFMVGSDFKFHKKLDL